MAINNRTAAHCIREWTQQALVSPYSSLSVFTTFDISSSDRTGVSHFLQNVMCFICTVLARNGNNAGNNATVVGHGHNFSCFLYSVDATTNITTVYFRAQLVASSRLGIQNDQVVPLKIDFKQSVSPTAVPWMYVLVKHSPYAPRYACIPDWSVTVFAEHFLTLSLLLGDTMLALQVEYFTRKPKHSLKRWVCKITPVWP
jgi:hypothetical protein